jgi:hypothetical protein
MAVEASGIVIRRRMSIPRWLSFLVALTTLPMLFAIAAPPAAKADPAGCTNANGVSVVVDLRQLGGGILDRCAPGLGAGATGLQALQTAGIPYQGTSQWGDAFICRLLGRPAADESLHIPGNSNYHEQCITTPPASAYWAYWWAPNGGPWHYSSAGVSSHHITPGGFEGWVYTIGGANQEVPPGIAPVRAAAGPAPATSAPHVQQNVTGPASAGPSTAAAGAASNSVSTHQPSTGQAGSSTSAAAAAASPRASSSSPAGTGPADTGVSTSITAVGGRAPSHSHGISTGAILGACLLAFLVTIGAGTAWRQARARRQS